MRTMLFLGLLLANASVAQTTARDFKKLLRMFPGQYDSMGEAFKGSATEKEQFERMHITVAPVKIPFLGKHVFYVKYLKQNDSKQVYRQRLYVFRYDKNQKAIVSEAHSFQKDSTFVDLHLRPEQQKSLTMAQIKSSLGCPSTWQTDGDGYVGRADSCSFYSARRQENIFIYDKMRLSPSGLATSEMGKDKTGKILFGSPADYALKLNRWK